MKLSRKARRAACLFACLLALAAVCMPVSAAVYTAKEPTGSADTVYIAGNPDLFPLEYYNRETKAFCGVIPDMLSLVSEKTGISFTYISAAQGNSQEEAAKNNQAEMLTAVRAGQDDYKVTELLPILEINSGGSSVTYCVGFTEIAPPELVQTLKSAFSEISEQEKMGLLLANSRRNPEVKSKSRLIKIILITAVSLFAAAGVIITVIVYRKKRRSSDTQIDEHTGIGNEKYYTYAFEQLLSRQSKNLYALIYLAADIDGLTAKYGEKAIAETERCAAAHLNAAIASAEYLAKISDGVFALLIQALTEQECKDKTLNILKSLNGYIQEFYPEMPNAFRAGISRLCEHPDCNAETAFYNAKQGYLAALRDGAPVSLTRETHLAQSKKQEKLRKALSKAVTDGEFRVYLQLITENKAGKVCGAEVLSRWQNSEYGMLRPHEYIELLKETGQIIAHDYKMFSAACRQLEAWEKSPYDRLFLTCNFTRISLSQNDFFDRITEISSGFNFGHGRLIMEVTEDSIAENSEIVSENIRKCREMGFKIAIDDMGTGFSAFADLYDNEIDLVKIDGGFIAACTSPRRKTMLSDIISLVHHSGAKILCEGVETPEQVEFLNGMNCDMMQGFYFSKILPQTECEKFLGPEKICESSVF